MPPPLPQYLVAVLALEALAAVVGHLVPDEVGLPVKGFRTLIAFVFPFLCVDDHMLAQAA